MYPDPAEDAPLDPSVLSHGAADSEATAEDGVLDFHGSRNCTEVAEVSDGPPNTGTPPKLSRVTPLGPLEPQPAVTDDDCPAR